MHGFTALPLVIILVIAGVVGVGWYTFSANQQAKVTVSPSIKPTVLSTPSPTLTPTFTPKPTLKPTIKLSPTPSPSPSPTPTPTPTPTSSSQSSGCNTSTDLGNLTVNIQPNSGESLVGDASVNMSNGSGDCAGNDSRLPYTQIIRQGSTSITFPSFRPGKFHIQVGYHGNNYDNDVNINPGDNSITVTVNN